MVPLLPGLCLLLGYHNYAPYTEVRIRLHTYVLIGNTLGQHKMAMNSCMVLCCQNQVSEGTNQCNGLHDSANISVHGAFVTVLGLLKKKKKKKNRKKHSVQNGVLAVFRLAT